MKPHTLPWAAALAAAVSLNVFTAAAQDEPPPSPPPGADHAEAGPPPHGRRMGGRMGARPGMPGLQMLLGPAGERLGVTEEQKGKLKEILEESRAASKPLEESLRKEQAALRPLIQADTLDEAALRAQAQKVGAIEADLAVERAKTFQKARGVLTPEQIGKLKSAGDRMRGMREHRGKRPGRERPQPSQPSQPSQPEAPGEE